MKIKIKYIAILLLCSYSSISKAQDETGWFNRLDIGIERSFFTDIGIYNVRCIPSDASALGIEGSVLSIGAGAEFVINKETLIAPKITATYIYEILYFRTDACLYTNFNRFQPVLTPKIGLGIFGLFIFYGRNIPLNNHQPFQGLGSNQFGISFSLLTVGNIMRPG